MYKGLKNSSTWVGKELRNTLQFPLIESQGLEEQMAELSLSDKVHIRSTITIHIVIDLEYMYHIS